MASDFSLHPDQVILAEQATHFETIIWNLCHLFVPQSADGQPSPIYDQILKRELESSTYLGHGVALPHVRIDSVERIEMAVARLMQPIPWCGNADHPTQLVILLVIPTRQVSTYLGMVKTLINAFRNRSLSEQLQACVTADDLASKISTLISRG